MSAGASWYDVLDVDPAAATDDIRAAWRAAIADLTPADRRFRLYNQAAEVLLDDERRAAYDAELAAAEPAETEDPELAGPTGPAEPAQPSGPAEPATAPAPVHEAVPAAGRTVPTWLVAALALLTAASVALTSYLWTQPSEAAVEDATGTARAAAERAVVPLLSYDYRTLPADQSAAHDVMTSDYRKDDYDELFAVIEENAPGTQTVVDVEVVSSAIVRAGDDRAQILLFVNRPTTNKATTEPVVYKDQVTLTMARVGEEWLVDDLATSPIAR